jgi:protein-tyrosine phosphatase
MAWLRGGGAAPRLLLQMRAVLSFVLVGLSVACSDAAVVAVREAARPRGARLERLDVRVGSERADAALPPMASSDAALPDEPAATSGAGHTPGEAILLPYLTNARELGGTPLAGGAHVPFGRLFRGPPLAALSADGCDAATRLGIRSVVDLRVPSEVASQPESGCIQSRATVIAAPLPIPYAVSAGDYIAILDARASLRTLFSALTSPGAYPIYIHCTWGRDRTGVVAALVLSALGADRETILEEYLLSRESVGAYPQSLLAALDEVELRGGIEAYLTGLGVTHEQLQALRKQATEPAP